MPGVNERTVQDAVLDRLQQPDLGWTYVTPNALRRSPQQVMIEDDVIEALVRLNPVIAEKPERVDEILPRLRAAILAVGDDGLTRCNQALSAWLRGLITHKFVGADQFVPIRLIDFDDPLSNRLVISDEVVCVGADTRRYDIVHFVNGFPLVTGEAKTPVKQSTSWLNAASDIHDVYEIKTPGWFVPNVFSYATDGKECRYGAIRQPAEMWLVWSKTTDPQLTPDLKSVLRSVELLLAPKMILAVLRDFTFYTTSSSAGTTQMRKVVPRYPQVEAVDAIVARVKDPLRRQGLIWHHQGSGKTLAMAFAASKLRRDLALDAPTIVVVLDRLDLYEQLSGEFIAAGITGLKRAETSEDLRKMLAEDGRGVIATTIFRFRDAGLLNERRNIVVMVDEAHRTQEGRLGADMREALPNAVFIGLTGTPVSNADRNTWETFGHPDDPDRVLNHYTPSRSIADGATLPVHVESRLVDFHIRREELDKTFEQFVAEAGLSDEESALLVRKAGSLSTILGASVRVEAIAADIVTHFREKIAPLGLKAQVVAYDRALCIRYLHAIKALLTDSEDVTVVMTVNTTKEPDPDEWQQFDRDRAAENAVKENFRDPHDPLCFLVVTSKLLTGFDAPIEGVMYLDKPLRSHNLFQAIARTNRRYTNPITGQEKQYGLIVDYVGLGAEIAKALSIQYTDSKRALPADLSELYAEFGSALADCLDRFDGIDRSSGSAATLIAAQDRIPAGETRDDFAKEYLHAQALFEFLYPDPELRPYEADYRWLAKIYASVQPFGASNTLLWRKYGAKTQALIAAHVENVEITKIGPDKIVMDAHALQAMQQLDFEFDGSGETKDPPTAQEVLDSIERRLVARAKGKPHPVYESLAKRLDDLRRSVVHSAEESVDYLQKILELAKDLTVAVRADDEKRLDELTPGLLPDPNIGALTQIFREYAPGAAPDMIERVVLDIDEIVRQVRFVGWQTSSPGDRAVRREIRKVLTKQALPGEGPLYDRAYQYVREYY